MGVISVIMPQYNSRIWWCAMRCDGQWMLVHSVEVGATCAGKSDNLKCLN